MMDEQAQRMGARCRETNERMQVLTLELSDSHRWLRISQEKIQGLVRAIRRS